MCRILIFADIRPMGNSAVVVFGLGKNLLFKSILEFCGLLSKYMGSAIMIRNTLYI